MVKKKDALLEAQENSPVQFFGEVDMNPKGQVGSTYPGWMFPRLVEDLEEQIQYEEGQLRDQLLDAVQKANIQERLVQKKDRLQKIKDRRPRTE